MVQFSQEEAFPIAWFQRLWRTATLGRQSHTNQSEINRVDLRVYSRWDEMVGEGREKLEMVDGGGIRGYVSFSATNHHETGLACRHRVSCTL